MNPKQRLSVEEIEVRVWAFVITALMIILLGSVAMFLYSVSFVTQPMAGMAPIDKPRIIVAVMIDEPSNGVFYGGAVAAPVFSEVVQQTLRMMGVQPDMAVKPQIVANAVEESL